MIDALGECSDGLSELSTSTSSEDAVVPKVSGSSAGNEEKMPISNHSLWNVGPTHGKKIYVRSNIIRL